MFCTLQTQFETKEFVLEEQLETQVSCYQHGKLLIIIKKS